MLAGRSIGFRLLRKVNDLTSVRRSVKMSTRGEDRRQGNGDALHRLLLWLASLMEERRDEHLDMRQTRLG